MSENEEMQSEEVEEAPVAESEEEYSPPSQEEWAKVRAALKKANNEAMQLRLARKEKELSSPAPVDPIAELEAKHEIQAKRLAAIVALTSEGLSKDQAKKAVKLLDLTNVTLDEYGDAEGIESHIEDLKEVFPTLFARESRSGGGRRPETADRAKSAAPSSLSEMTKKLLRSASH